LETATRASLGQRWNQSIVQPDISPGNFSDRLLNFSPTFRNAYVPPKRYYLIDTIVTIKQSLCNT